MNVKIFIDFWNLQLSWNEYHRKLGSSHPSKDSVGEDIVPGSLG